MKYLGNKMKYLGNIEICRINHNNGMDFIGH